MDKEFPPALRFLLKQLRCGHRVLIYSYSGVMYISIEHNSMESDMSSVFAVCLSALSLAFDEKGIFGIACLHYLTPSGRLRQSQNINISKADIQKRSAIHT